MMSHNDDINDDSSVTTDDEVRGQFTIPGLRTFNVVTPQDENRNVRRRNVGATSSNSGTNSEQTGEAEERRSSSTETENVFDSGDINEDEVNINVRYLDESVMNCSFRPSQSLGHFKCKYRELL